jgi:hypothetical protein
MPTTSNIVSVNIPASNWKQKLHAAILTRSKTKIRILGPLASTIRAQFVAVTMMPPPKPPAAVPVPAPPATCAVFLANQPELLALVVLAFSHCGFTFMTVSYDGKGAGTADNELHFWLT